MNTLRIQDARTADDHTILVTFTNGEKKKYDITSLLKKEVFPALRNPASFINTNFGKGGYAVSWNADIDISEFEIWKNGALIND